MTKLRYVGNTGPDLHSRSTSEARVNRTQGKNAAEIAAHNATEPLYVPSRWARTEHKWIEHWWRTRWAQSDI